MLRIITSSLVLMCLLITLASPAVADDAKAIANIREAVELVIEKRNAQGVLFEFNRLRQKFPDNPDTQKIIDELATKGILVVRADINTKLMARDAQVAIRNVQELQKVFPKHPLSRTIQAQIALMQQQGQTAIQMLQAVLEEYPHYPDASAIMAQIELQSAQADAAKKRLADALAQHPKAPALLELSAGIAGSEQRLDDALSDWQTFVGQDIIDPRRLANAYSQIGLIQNHKGNTEQALESLKKALDAVFDVRVAFQALQLQQQTGDVTGGLETIKTIRNWANDPSNAQFRVQVIAQIEGTERALKIAQLDQLIEAEDFTTASWRADFLARQMATHADPNVKAMLPQVQERQIDASLGLLKQWVAKEHAVTAIRSRADKIIELATDSESPKATEALAYAQQVKIDTDAREAKESEGYLKLVKEEGWTLPDFVSPRGDKKERMDELGLKELKAAPPAAKDMLKAHFEPIAAEREPGPIEPIVEKLILNPGDESAVRTLGQAVRKQLGSKPKADAAFEVIPAVVWTQDPGQTYKLPGGRPTGDRRDKGYTTFHDGYEVEFVERGQWQQIIDLAIAANKHYPDWRGWQAAGTAAFMLGDYERAADYLAASAAVAAYEERYTFKFSIGKSKQWAKDAAYSIVAAANQGDSGLADDPLPAMVSAMKAGDWFTVAEMNAKENKTFLGGRMNYYMEHRYFDEILDAVVEQMRQTKDDQRLAYLDQVAKNVFASWNHPGYQVFLAEQALAEGKTDEAARLVKSAIRGEWDDAHAHLFYAKLLENQGKTDEAILEYNAAAQGQRAQNAQSPIAQKAAEARNRLLNFADLDQANATTNRNLDSLWKQTKREFRNNDVTAARLVYLGHFLSEMKYEPAWIPPTAIALGYSSLSESELTREYAEKALAMEGNSNTLLLNSELSRAYLELDDPTSALKYANAALRLKPDSSLSQGFKLEALHDLKRYAEVITLATKMIQENPKNFTALKFRSFAWEGKRDYGKASTDARAAEDIAKENNWIMESTEMNVRQLHLLNLMNRQIQGLLTP